MGDGAAEDIYQMVGVAEACYSRELADVRCLGLTQRSSLEMSLSTTSKKIYRMG